MSKLSVPPATK